MSSNNLKHTLFIIISFLSITIHAQKGVISGKVFDQEEGEVLLGAIVEIKKDGNVISGVATDLDGNYRVDVDPGTYAVSVNYLSYANFLVNDVIISPKEFYTLDVALQSESQSLTEVVVKAEDRKSVV